MKKVCIIGGGISGLCVAFRLRKAGARVVLFESSASVGGNIKTEIRDGFLIEHGPNSLLASREIFDLIEDLKIRDQIACPSTRAKRRFILRDGRLTALPSKVLDILTTEAFSARARLRLLKEPFVRGTSSEDESVREFFERRLGKEIADYAVDPFVSGIYAGDPAKLSVRSAFPRLFELEKVHGSLIRGMVFAKNGKASRPPKGSPRSFSFKAGMQTLTDALRSALGDSVRLGTGVSAVRSDGAKGCAAETFAGTEDFDAVVVSVPADAAAAIVENLDPALANELSKIYYPPVAVAFTAFRREQVEFAPEGFGFLIPALEHRRILGSLWTSSVFENRAPDGYHLFTTFIGGSRNADLCELSEDELLKIASEELNSILGTRGEPAFAFVKKWPRAIPQYNIGYEKVLVAAERFRNDYPGIFFCSNFYKGISVGDCVKNSIAVADSILQLSTRSASSA